MGGAYFSFSMVMSLGSVPVISYLYLEYAKVPGQGAEKISADTLWAFSIGILVAWAALFLLFMACIVVPEYRKTFWSLQSGRQTAESTFLDNEEDGMRILIFTVIVVLWSRIKEDVKAWTMANWETWDEEKPEWFTPTAIARIPDEFIPPRFLAKLGEARERRGSAAGGIRESLRRGSSVLHADAAAAAAEKLSGDGQGAA
jgi:hypothetical protein